SGRHPQASPTNRILRVRLLLYRHSCPLGRHLVVAEWRDEQRWVHDCVVPVLGPARVPACLRRLDTSGVAVGLTAEVELSLIDAGLVTFYDKNKKAFAALATRAYAFAFANVHETGLTLRKDDVAKSLTQALTINEDLRECLAQKKLRQKFWYER